MKKIFQPILNVMKTISGYWKKFKNFYQRSAENRIQFHLFLGFLILPTIAMTVLYIVVNLFWIK